jgi:iron complex outermembrane recepter protein
MRNATRSTSKSSHADPRLMAKREWPRPVVCRNILLVLAILVLALPLSARADTVEINLAAQPLSSALSEFSRQTGIQVAIRSELSEGAKAPSLSGRYEPGAALEALLKGSGLEAYAVNANTYGIREAQNPASASAAALQTIGYQDGQNVLLAQNEAPPPPAPTEAQTPAATEPAPASGGAEHPNELQEVVVSSSRINLAGFDLPTPVSTINAATLEQNAQADLGEVFHNLPSFGAASSPDTTSGAENISNGAAGLSQINLRNLGTQRTLVLINGTRQVNADITEPGVDLNTLPDALIQRIDVVQGGASAAWGSDAVAGVVNFIMDNTFQGFKANIEGGDNLWGDKASEKANLAGGSSFADGKGNFVLALSYLNQPDNPLYSDANYWQHNGASAIVPNPNYAPTNGQPQYITVQGAGLATATNGGLIVSNPAGFGGLNANALRGIQFVGPSGTPSPFYFGTVAPNGLCYNGCSALAPAVEGQNDPLGVPIQNTALYGHVQFQMTDAIRASLEVNYGRSETNNSSITYQPDVTIQANNAYLPSSVAATMASLGIPSFTMGTTNFNNLVPLSNPLASPNSNIASLTTNSIRSLYRGVLGLDGTIGQTWTWSARYQHSENDRTTRVGNTVITADYMQAVNAVYVTPTNVGSSGLPIGSIACQSTLTHPKNGCVPLNVFGDGVASQAAINYVDPGLDSGNTPTQDMILRQDTVDLSMTGKPFSTWAGPVGVAFGGDYRREAATEAANALALQSAYAAGNFSDFSGEYGTKEGFAEINAPLLKHQWVESLNFDAAGRLTDYTTSGRVETWKIGLVSQVNDDVLVRASYSDDIRAPEVYELFNKGEFYIQAAVLPTGQTTNLLLAGNPNLQPEISRTTSAGLVLTPEWVPHLSMSADFYSIIIKDAIFTPTATQVYDECTSGVAIYCAALVRNSAGAITEIEEIPLNAATETTEGVDFQMDYQHDLYGGRLILGALGNYTANETTTSAVGVQDIAGSLIDDNGGNGVPKFRATAQATYEKDRWSGTIQTRIIGSSSIDNLFHEGTGPESIDDNSIPAVAYLDLRASYIVGAKRQVQFYGAIDNVLNRAPPIIPYGLTEIHPGFYVPTNSNYYDILGTVWRIGFRANLGVP